MENNKSKKSVNRVKKFFPILRSKSIRFFKEEIFHFSKFTQRSLSVSPIRKKTKLSKK